MHGKTPHFVLSCGSEGLDVLICPSCSGVHEPSTTRSQIPGQDGNPSDIAALRKRRQRFLEQASAIELRKELWCATREAHVLRSHLDWNDDALHWREQVHRLQLHRLRLENDLRQLGGRGDNA